MDKHLIFRIILVVLAAFVLFVVIYHYNSKQKVSQAEKFYEDTLNATVPLAGSNPSGSFGMGGDFGNPAYIAQKPLPEQAATSSVGPSEEDQSSSFRPVDFSTEKVPGDCFPKDRLSADDLLPKDAANAKWAQVNPAGQGDVRDQNFLTAGALVGIDTVGSTLRNASHDIRSEPANPRGTWPIMNSTIEADVFRRPLEIQSDCGQ